MMPDYGWRVDPDIKYQHDWSILRTNVQNHIKAINFGYKSKVSEIGVDYVNAFARFENDKSVKFAYGDDDQEY